MSSKPQVKHWTASIAGAGLWFACVFLSFSLPAAPFNRDFSFKQPDGTQVTLHGKGDEFQSHFETMDGFTVVFDPALRAYCYAALSSDGATLVSTGLPAHQPSGNAVARHLRPAAESARRQYQFRRRQWETTLGLAAQPTAAVRTPASAGPASAPTKDYYDIPTPHVTTGTRVGLCLLIDFEDDPATVPQADIVEFCNGDDYHGFGNGGSVKQYFLDNSNNQLHYTNIVTVYLRIPNTLHPKSYYNDPLIHCQQNANRLIPDALETLKRLPNYFTEILPAFNALTVDASNHVVACNVFYAGDNGGVWDYGLWPHAWVLSVAGEQDLGNGMKIYPYQISNIGDWLGLFTFCHESGHLLCGLPDFYDYESDSVGGAGAFCLMGDWLNDLYPPQLCALAKTWAGWAELVELDKFTIQTATVAAPKGQNFNRFYRFGKPGVPTEYYLIENRQRLGWDVALPGRGVTIWHVDELGNRDSQSTNYNTTHANFVLSLVQADNQFHLQRNLNRGDMQDLFYEGNPTPNYANAFADGTAPSARWWDGSASGLNLTNFSANNPTMTFDVAGTASAPVFLVQPAGLTVTNGSNVTLVASVEGTRPLALQWNKNGAPLPGATNATLSLPRIQTNAAGVYTLSASNTYGATVSSNAQLVVIYVLSLSEALGTPFLTWETWGGDVWHAETNLTHQSPSATQSGYPGNANSSFLRTTVMGPGVVSFWWKVSSETNFDFLCFSTAGTNATISGDVAWQYRTLPVAPGWQTLTWSYEKDVFFSEGADCGWLDEVVYTPNQPTIYESPADQISWAGSNLVLHVAASATAPAYCQWFLNSVPVPNATNTTLNFAPLKVSDGGSYVMVLSNSFGAVTSAPVNLAVFSPPRLRLSPRTVFAESGGTAVFTIDAEANPAPAYAWRTNQVFVPDEHTNELIFNELVLAQNGTLVDCVVTNSFASLTSAPVQLRVVVKLTNAALVITAPESPNEFRLTIQAEESHSYTLEYADSLQGTNTLWHPVTTISGVAGPIPLTDPEAANPLRRFYRVKID